MTPDEAVRLLAHAAAFDNRQPSRVAAQAWAAALRDIPLDQDTLDAVAAFYGTVTLDDAAKFDPTKRRWLEPHHVRYHRQKIRNARLGEANVMYDGNPDETAIESITNRRALLSAAASGQFPAQAPAAALTSSEAVDAEGRGRAILNAVGRETLSRRPEFAAPCPHCAAEVGRPCVNGRGQRRRDAHPSRIVASRQARAGETPAAREDVERELDRRRAASANALAALPPGTVVEPNDGFEEVNAS
ncbi:zinc finger domain-containing protein [Streptomyces hygroscopicus]|uniref:zinc finger domain-containing protein n=1 Tax=Streptomyces hygroscopicus TaxID=1912 RepID=UPI0033F48FE1